MWDKIAEAAAEIIKKNGMMGILLIFFIYAYWKSNITYSEKYDQMRRETQDKYEQVIKEEGIKYRDFSTQQNLRYDQMGEKAMNSLDKNTEALQALKDAIRGGNK